MNCLGFMKMRFATDKYMFPYFLEVLDLASRQGGRDRELAVEHVTEKKRPVIAGLDLHPRLYTKEPSRCKRADQYSILLLVFKQYCSPNMNYVANNVLPPKHANNAIWNIMVFNAALSSDEFPSKSNWQYEKIRIRRENLNTATFQSKLRNGFLSLLLKEVHTPCSGHHPRRWCSPDQWWRTYAASCLTKYQ